MTIHPQHRPRNADTVMWDAHEELMNAHGHATAMKAVASGAIQTLSEHETAAYLAAKTPLAFWRWGTTQQLLANAIGVLQAYVAQIENGPGEGSPTRLRDMAQALRVRMEHWVG